MKKPAAAPKREPKKPERAPLPRWKRLLFILVGFVLFPLLLLGFVELGLRVAGYGYSTAFFKRVRIKDTDCFVENDKFGLRFFPPALARSPPPVVMKAAKATNSYRIFIVGESAALGDPRPAFGPGRYLEALLRQRFPDIDFEVVCVAVTAINSHAILPIVRECARHEPDLWMIYMGNNEMVGPFGAATVFGAQAPPRWLIRLNLAAQKLRLGQLLSASIQKFRGQKRPPGGWAGMEMFMNNRLAPDSPRKATVYKNFKANLDDILDVARGSGAPVLLNTVAVNLKDCPPFASVARTNLAVADYTVWEKTWASAISAEDAGKRAEAAELYQQAEKLQPRFAELQYRWGEALLQTNSDFARAHFQQACDDDALPFRADTSINAAITGAAAQRNDSRLFFLDAVALFNANSPGQIAGKELFYEHVHFNFNGNYLLARAWAERVAPVVSKTKATRASADWASQIDCESRLGLTDWNRAGVLEDVILRLQQPPFTGRLNNTQYIAAARASLAALRQGMTTNATSEAMKVYEAALDQAPNDHRLHENFAEFLEDTRRIQLAELEWETICQLLPHHHVGYFQCGRLLALEGKTDEAEASLRHALRLRPDLSEGWFELGKLHSAQSQYDLALTEFERARALFPQDYRVYYFMGKAQSRQGHRAAAITNFIEAAHLRPNNWQAHYALGEEMAFDGRAQQAREQFELVLRLNPNHVLSHLNLGVALFKLGLLDQAKAQFSETLRLNPGNPMAQDYLRQLENARYFKP